MDTIFDQLILQKFFTCEETDCSIIYILQFHDYQNNYFCLPELEIIVDHLIHKLVHIDPLSICKCVSDLRKIQRQIKVERMNQDCCEHLEDIEILVNDCFGKDKIGFKQIQRICNEQIVAILSWSFGDISENPEIQFPNIITCV